MNGREFLDSNILVYAYDRSNVRKASRAQELVRRAVAGEFVASTQVLGEFAATLLHKSSPAINSHAVAAILDALEPIPLVPLDAGTIRLALQAQGKYGVYFYDGLILAAAERGGCTRIWSEDLNSGQKYFGVRVENPFV
ncbi:MAG TPA: PIN domain-containing protein [Candidatus Acidoferrales bacterium]|nr:PIN domain-containing protein [Candidatus Acidoferrales bacterium]